MALLKVLLSTLLFSHLVLGSEMLDYLEQVSHLNGNISHDRGLNKLSKSPCPPWKYRKDNNSSCVCGLGMNGIVQCSNASSTVLLLTCHCMSYREDGDGLVMGACPYFCTNNFYTRINADTNFSNICKCYPSE